MTPNHETEAMFPDEAEDAAYRKGLADAVKLTEAQRRAIGLFSCWWAMVSAENELAGEPIDPEAIVLNFMGSGASCMVHAKDLTELCKLLGTMYGEEE